ncbi:MAG: 50S ribosomal protein L11 methyltransferase [Spartobacteria bacterium]
MILWQKYASAAWLAANELSLQELAANDLAIISRPGKARSLLQIPCRQRVSAEELVRSFGGTARQMPRNWSQSARAQSSHPPIRIGRRLEILSEPPPPNHRPHLLIPAAGAFGTGDHATTAMSLRLLEETTRNFPTGWKSLDAGTGTGILALAARRFGARDVLGLDNDPRAIAYARQNARLNHIAKIRFSALDLLLWKPDARYEIITANLFSELLIAALPIFHRALVPSGNLIVSGILCGQAEAVVRALRRAGFQLGARRRRGKWVALRARRKT